jgi:hypothetical protein
MGERATKRPRRFDVGELIVEIALSPSESIIVVTAQGKVVGIDGSGWRAWERRWPVDPFSHRLTLRVADDGRPWVGHGGVLTEIDHDGSDRTSLEVARGDGEQLGSFLLAPDGFYVCLYRPRSTRRRLFRPRSTGRLEPRVMKLDPSGSPLWSTTLPVGAISYHGLCEVTVHTGGKIQPRGPMQPETWMPLSCEGSESLLLSGDRLLASFSDFPRSGIGRSYGLDAVSGALLWVTEPGPMDTLAIAGTGRFYQGLQGYGTFETRLLGPDGVVLQRWESHGDLVIDEGGRVRCVEMENVLPSRMRYSLLLPDGAVQRGPRLDGYATTYPLASREGVIAFWRNGELVLIDEGMAKEVIESDPSAAEEGVLSRMLLSPWGSLVFAIGHEVRVVDAGLGSLAESPWPCGGGNPQNNPVWV